MPAAVAKAAQYAHVEALLIERNSQRSIARMTGVVRMTIIKRLKKAAAASPSRPRLRPKKTQRKEREILELDELWSFVGHKQRKVWLWLAVERARWRIVGWTLGNRGVAPLRQLWQSLPRRYYLHYWYFIDQWKVYARVLPLWQHRPCAKGEGQTNIVEAINCSLRQRRGVLVGKSCSFSKSLAMHTARIKIVIDNYNRNIILD